MTSKFADAPSIRNLLVRAIDALDAGQEVDLLDLERKCLEAALSAHLDAATAERAGEVLPRPCTCHPDDKPPRPCPRKYALTECRQAHDPTLTERAGEVLERLRKADEYEPLGHDGWEAADLITALLTANAALRAERDAWQTRAMEQMNRATKASQEAAAAIVDLEAEVEKLRTLLEGWLQLASHCDISEGVCCCGESMEGHSNPMDCGHTPLDHGTYIAVQLGKETRAAITTEERHD